MDPRWLQPGSNGPLSDYDWGSSSATQPAGQEGHDEDARPTNNFANNLPHENNFDEAASTGPSFACFQCGATFPKKGSLTFVFKTIKSPKLLLTYCRRRHVKTHDRPFSCGVAGCTASFAFNKDLRRHEEDVHGSTRFYCCYPGCSYKLARDGTSRRENLERHVRNQHKVQGSTAEFIASRSDG